MKIKIQPQGQGGSLPYPFWIDENALVGRQDFWRGRPYKLIGFSHRLKAGECDLMFTEWWDRPELAVGKFPVFADEFDNWYTDGRIIESVTVKDEEVKS